MTKLKSNPQMPRALSAHSEKTPRSYLLLFGSLLYFIFLAVLYVMKFAGDASVSHLFFVLASLTEIAALIGLLCSNKNILAAIYYLYIYLVFIFVYPLSDIHLAQEGQFYFCLAVAGYLIGACIATYAMPHVEGIRQLALQVRNLTSAESAILIAGITLRLVQMISLLASYGLRGYIGGIYMAERTEMYASHSIPFMFLSIAQYGSVVLCIAGLSGFIRSGRVYPSIFVTVLIVLPIITLDRGALTAGVIALFYAFRNRIRFRHVIAGCLLALSVAVAFANLRLHGMKSQNRLSTMGAIIGELTVAEDVQLIAETIRRDGPAYGKNLIGPLIMMPIPRAIFPEKPKNTSTVIMEKYHPDAARNGFYLAPTIFGDWLYNFGNIGVFVVCALLGILIVRLGSVQICPFGFIVAYNFYSLLRDNCSQSAAFIIITFLIAEVALRVNWSGHLGGLRFRIN